MNGTFPVVGSEVRLPYARNVKGTVQGTAEPGEDGSPGLLVRWLDGGDTPETCWHPAFLMPWDQDPALDPSPIEPTGSQVGCRRPREPRIVSNDPDILLLVVTPDRVFYQVGD